MTLRKAEKMPIETKGINKIPTKTIEALADGVRDPRSESPLEHISSHSLLKDPVTFTVLAFYLRPWPSDQCCLSNISESFISRNVSTFCHVAINARQTFFASEKNYSTSSTYQEMCCDILTCSNIV